MPRMPLTEQNVLEVMNSIGCDTESIFYPILLAIPLGGRPKDVRQVLEKLTQKGILRRHTSKIPLAHKIFGYGYYKPKQP